MWNNKLKKDCFHLPWAGVVVGGDDVGESVVVVIVVVGGRDLKGTMKSVEVYDLQRSKWTEPKNLELPLGICYAEITPHPTGKKSSVLHHDLAIETIFLVEVLFFSQI